MLRGRHPLHRQAAAFTPTVSAVSPGTGTPTGTVTFYDGPTTLGSATLGGTGAASTTTSYLSVGSHSIKVSYGGDADFKGSTSAVLNQVVQSTASAVIAGSAVVAADQDPGALQYDTPDESIVHDLALEQVSSRSWRSRRVVKT